MLLTSWLVLIVAVAGFECVNTPCTNYASCAKCSYKTECDRACQEVNGVKKCFCQCYYPCDAFSCPPSPITGKDTKCSEKNGTSGCYIPYGNRGRGCPSSEYRCDTYKKNSRSGAIEVLAIFFYKKCEMDAECATVLTNCAGLVGEGCVPKCNVKYKNKKFCTCLCPGTLA